MVSKEKSCSWRRCADYRKLNANTDPDRYPISEKQDLTSQLHGAEIISKVDLTELQSNSRKFETRQLCSIVEFER